MNGPLLRWSALCFVAGLASLAAQEAEIELFEAEDFTPLQIDDSGPPSLLDPAGRQAPRLPSVLPGVDTRPAPRLSDQQAAQANSAIDHVWNDTTERTVAVIQIEPDGDFVQLIGMSTGAVLDYPLATDRQRLLAQSIAATLVKYGYTPTRRDLGEGQQAMQVPVVSAKEDLLDAVAAVLVEGFSLRPEGSLKIITGEQ
ncbi:MAG: hypothetical protein AAGK14_07080 [Verrucomicrobiota bacterium]